MATLEISLFAVRLSSQRPEDTPNWEVQYFNGTTAMTIPSLQSTQRVAVDDGPYTFFATWTKPEENSVSTSPTTVEFRVLD